MNVKIGSIIKKLRKENNVTQDALASAIGVTPQAISRWESENGYPDIELLPVLADFFSVSTDELLGYKMSEKEAELENIKKEVRRLSARGASLDEFIAYARKAYSRYPSDYWIKERLASYLFDKWWDTRESSLFDEIINLCEPVIEGCTNEYIRHDAICTMIWLYQENGNPDKMTEYLNKLPEMRFCREFTKACGIGDNKTELYVQEHIDRLAFCLANAITNYANHGELPNNPSTWDKKTEMLKVSNRIFQMIYGDNLMIYHAFVAENYRLLSAYQIAQEKEEEALDSLEKMCYHRIESDKSYINDHGKHFTSVFTDKLTYEYANQDTYYTENWTHSACYNALCKLKHERYDPIRSHPRFIEIVNRLNEYAK